MEKDEFLKTLVFLTERLITRTEGNGIDWIQDNRVHLEKFKKKASKVLELLKAIRYVQELRNEFNTRTEGTKLKVKLLIEVKNEVVKMRSPDKYTGVINKSLSTEFTSEEVILYACRISNYIQAFPEYRIQDTIFPWSFGENTVEIPEIESSKMYYMYKGNTSYQRLNPPQLKYLNETAQNIVKLERKDDNHFIVTVKGSVTFSLQKNSGERIIYTTDGREPIPIRDFFGEPQPEIVSTNKNMVLQVRSFKPGFIDSPKAVYHFTVEEPDDNMKEENLNMLNEMKRPDELGDEFEVGSAYLDLFDNGEGFSSIHLNGGLTSSGN